jgi:transcriptional regulator with XRE-family HTH domain
MDTLVDTSGQAIARRIQWERKARKWSMADLAVRSDVSKAAISKIERGEMSPTASVLVRLAHAFDLTLAGLLVRAEQPDHAVQRAADQPMWQDPETNYIRRQIFRAADVPVEMAKIYLPVGASVTLPATDFEIKREVIYVLDGSLSITDAGIVHTLDAGDSYGLSKTADVTFSNPTTEPCTYLVALARN